jgi:hypothetical protein
MLDYALINNTDGAFPLVTSRNSTGPGNLDGTPYIKNFIDDLWGFSQALMSAAGLTPNAVQESATASQRLEAIRRISGYPGEVVSWMGDQADPNTLGIRLLQLKGQGVLRATYSELDAATWVGTTPNLTASAFYRADDAGGVTRNPTGVYLILPDLRGAFVRGLDVSGTVDPQGASRDIGNLQDWAVFDHSHQIFRSGGPGASGYASETLAAGANSVIDEFSGGGAATAYAGPGTGMRDSTFSAFSATNRNASESRPVNYTGRWCIRY